MQFFGGREITCPRCFRPMRQPRVVDKYLACRECHFSIPMTYIRDLRKMPPVFVQLFGLSAAGKTTFLDMLRLHLYDMDQVWGASGFFVQPVTQLDMDHRVILETQRNQGVLAPSTHKRDRNQNEVYIMALTHMARWGSRFLVLMDHAGESFGTLVIPVEEIPFLQHTPVTIVLLSLPDLLREGKRVNDVLNSYITSLENYKVRFGKDLRQLIIVFSKADLLPDLPIEVQEYLSRDTIYAALRDPQQKLYLGEQEMDDYLQRMNFISTAIEQWVRARVPSGPALLHMLHDKCIAYKFTAMSATGQPIVAGDQNLTPRPRRVLDPFFWVMEFYKQNHI
jgi:GTPase SAR1 family protein